MVRPCRTRGEADRHGLAAPSPLVQVAGLGILNAGFQYFVYRSRRT